MDRYYFITGIMTGLKSSIGNTGPGDENNEYFFLAAPWFSAAGRSTGVSEKAESTDDAALAVPGV
jgi:hypothetical protein